MSLHAKHKPQTTEGESTGEQYLHCTVQDSQTEVYPESLGDRGIGKMRQLKRMDGATSLRMTNVTLSR